MTGPEPTPQEGVGQGRGTGKAVLRQSSVASIAALVAVASGLLLDVTMAALFGAGGQTDAFVAAARLPFALTAILMVLSTQVLVPVFSSWGVRLDPVTLNRLSGTVLLLGLLAGSALAVLLALLAEPLLWLMAPGFGPEQHELAVDLSRVMVAMIPLTAGNEVLRGWLNARHAYLVPAGMTLILNLVATAVLVATSSQGVQVIPWAYVVGAGVQLVVMVSLSALRGLRPARPAMRDPEIRHLSTLLTRPTIGASLNPVTRIAETVAASFLPSGSLTILHYGNRLVHAIGGTVLFRSVMIASLPRMTRAFANENRTQASYFSRLTIQLLLALSIPLTTLGVVLALPMSVAVFGLGEFAGESAELLGITMAVYALSFVGSGLQRGLLAPFYAVRNTKVPLANTLWGIAANVLLLPIAVLPLMSTEFPVVGVAIAYVLAQYVNVAHAGLRLRRADLVDLHDLRGSSWRAGVAGVVAGLVSAGALAVANAAAEGLQGSPELIAASVVAGGLGLSAYVGILGTDPRFRSAVRGLRRKGPATDPTSTT